MSSHEILLVGDDPEFIQPMKRILVDVCRNRVAMNGESALRMAHESIPDLVLMTTDMPGMNGFQVLQAMKADQALSHVPVILVARPDGSEFETTGLDLGAIDFIVQPIDESKFLARVKARLRAKRQADQLRQTSTIDALTNLPNRRSFDDVLEREWLRGLRQGDAISLLLVDVDHFVAYTDRYGQSAAEKCLSLVAAALSTVAVRPADLVARYSRDQFAVLLPHSLRAGAEHIAHRVLDDVETYSIAHAGSPTSRHVTVSIGVGCYDKESVDWVEPSVDSRFGGNQEVRCAASELRASAEKALSAAKSSGRAQAWFLDISNVEAPVLAREIAPERRARMVRARSPTASREAPLH